jgi:signal transduction histidine kinase/ActR/RegA family two-component response regulator
VNLIQKLSIKRKLLLLTMATTISALALANGGVIIYETKSNKHKLTNELLTLAKVIANYSKAALVFGDKKAAENALAVLEYKKGVTAACIYSSDGNVFARFPQSAAAASFPPAPEKKGYRFEEERFLLFQPIAYHEKDEVRGTLFIASDLSEVYRPSKIHLIILMIAMPLPLLIAFLVSSSLQGKISKPIEHLVRVAKTVSRQRDYSLRAVKTSDDEIGSLIDGFNDMLGQIQKRDRELQDARDELEKRVEARVKDLHVEIAERKKAEERERKLQEQLARSARMESLGILAGGVAHDLNNILGPIVAYPDLILKELPHDCTARDDVIAVRDSAIKAAAVIQDLLTLARRGSYQMQTVSINDVVTSYLNSPAFKEKLSLHSGVRVDTRLDEDRLPITGSAPHLSQVLMNLVINAMEATPGCGSITVETARQNLNYPRRAYDREITPGVYAVLRVADTGKGIDADDVEHIFEPFYTKKQMGRSGTGLGLAVVYGVVSDLDGFIDLQTTPGKGSTFSLYFPALPNDVKNGTVAEGFDIRGSESILVVDDDESQRTLASRLLSHLGYNVATVGDGHTAVQIVREHGFDLVILDMIMEDDFDGLETYKCIRQTRPQQRCIIASGFSETERVREAEALGSGLYIRKPYTIDEIGRAVRSMLCNGGDGRHMMANYQMVLQGAGKLKDDSAK